MNKPYTEYKFIMPPRPRQTIHPSSLRSFSLNGWIAQPKMNGEYNVVAVTPDRNLIASTRKGTKQKRWEFDRYSASAFKMLPGNDWYVFCCELMHNKTPHIKNVNYIHDVLVAGSKRLDDMRYLDRYALLQELFPIKKKTNKGYSIINNNLWLADVYDEKFSEKYFALTENDECEGLVIKNTFAHLCFTDPSRGMLKCRRATKNYGF